jgi:hypothetical protein
MTRCKIHEFCTVSAILKNRALLLCKTHVRKERLEMANIGYARVSTGGQHLEAQIAELSAAGADQIFREKISGAKSNRPQLVRALDALRPGDVLLVARLDRLARSTLDVSLL